MSRASTQSPVWGQIPPGTEFSFGRPQPSDKTSSTPSFSRVPDRRQDSGDLSSNPYWRNQPNPESGSYGVFSNTQTAKPHNSWHYLEPDDSLQSGSPPSYRSLKPSQPWDVSNPTPYPIAGEKAVESEMYAFPSRRRPPAIEVDNHPQASDPSLSGETQLTHRPHKFTNHTSSAPDRPTSDGSSGDDPDPYSEPLSILDSVNLSSLADNGGTLLRRALPVLGGLYLAQRALESASEATRFAANTALHPLHLPLAVSEQVASAATSVVSGGVGLAARGSANVLLGTAKTLPSALWTITKFGTRFTKHFVNSIAAAATS